MKKVKWPTIMGAFARYLTGLFLALRAYDMIDWPWYIILSPTISALVIAALCLAVYGIMKAAEEL